MQIDRGFIKWMPFDSITSSKKNLKTISQEKMKFKMPTLYQEQINYNEENILKSFQNSEKIKITYFKNGKIYPLITTIKNIDKISKKIILEDHKYLYFSQIISAIII